MEEGGDEAMSISPRYATRIGASDTRPQGLCFKPQCGPSDRGSGLEEAWLAT